MASIKARALREKTSQELQDQLNLEKKRMFDGIVKGASGEAIKPHEKRDGRRLIARIQSILRERELRADLGKRIADLAPKAEGAAQPFARLVKAVDTRNALITAALAAPPKEDRSRKVKPQLTRVRFRNVPGGKAVQPLPPLVNLAGGKTLRLPPLHSVAARKSMAANRAAVNLAEARRKLGSLQREDMGQGK